MHRRVHFEAIGTHWHIDAYMIDDAVWQALLQCIHMRIEAFDTAYSRFRNDSLVSQMAREAGTYTLPSDGPALFELYEKLYAITEGRVTPLIGQLLADAGYDAQYTLVPKTLVRPPKWEAVLARSGRQLTVKQPVLLDVGAAGKGYLVDSIAQLIEAENISSYTINAGGDIRYRGRESLMVGLENPYDTSEVIGTVQLSNRSLCASSGAKRAWGSFHHIINPLTMQPVTSPVAVWVIADDTLTADGIATALFFVSPEHLSHIFTFEYAVLDEYMQLTVSREFTAQPFEASHASN